MFSLHFQALIKSHVDKRRPADCSFRCNPYQPDDEVVLPRICIVRIRADTKQKVKVHELDTDLGQVKSLYCCRWFGDYGNATETSLVQNLVCDVADVYECIETLNLNLEILNTTRDGREDVWANEWVVG